MTERRPLILVADDEENILVLLHRLFEQNGFLVKSVTDGMSALEQAETLRPDLILIDVQMPGLDGFEVVRRLQQDTTTARIPTIFITAVARQTTDVVKGFDMGADDYILKPFNPRELLARARSKILARQLEEQLQRRTEELEALVSIGREFNQRLQLEELLDLIVSVCAAELPVEQMLLCLFDPDRNVAGWRLLDQAWMTETDVLDMVNDPDGLVHHVLSDNRPALLLDDTQVVLPPPCHVAMGTKIVHHGNVLGILVAGHSNGNVYDDGHLRLFESLAEQAALAIRNAELYAEAHHYALNLESMVAERTEALRAAQAQLVRSEKLAALGHLSAGIAHEVNNPLQAIRNCLELAIEDVDAQRPVDRELLTVAEEDVQRIRRIVSRLLDFARPSSSEMALISIDEMVSDVLQLAEVQLVRANVKVIKQIAPRLRVRVNGDQIKQVILNLILNAQEAMPHGGTLTIDASKHDREVYISFADTGVGIPEEYQAAVFDPFFSTKTEGSGLGLAVSYGIIEGHGGRIEMESHVGEGSRFTIVLPAN